ncbi:MAG: T9SS type A sorting domain-containing protein [Stygiobacter sp.]
MKKNILLLTVLVFFQNVNAQWKQVGLSLNSEITGLVKVNNTLFASTNKYGVFGTTDEATWSQKNTGISNLKINTITESKGIIAIGTDQGFYTSNNSGNFWVNKSDGLTIPNLALPYVHSISYSGNNIIEAGPYGIFIFTDNSSNWKRILIPPSTYGARGLYKSTNYVYCGVGPYIYRSTDDGLNWNNVVTSNTTIKNFYTQPNPNGGDIIYVGTLDGLFISTNNGTSWKESNSGLGYRNMNALVGTGQNLFTATENGGGVYYSLNGGTNWNDGNAGLPANSTGRALLLNNGFIYVGLSDGTVWKRNLTDFGITSVKEIAGEIPSLFELSQNYPNPFNPKTTIRYVIPSAAKESKEIASSQQIGTRNDASNVTLKVYDVLGKEVATLVNKRQSAGNYEVKFDASNLSSGIYFYKLQAGNFIQTKKMILTK